MGQVTLELSDVTLRKATVLAARKGVPLSTFLAYQINELIEAAAANQLKPRVRPMGTARPDLH